MFGNVGGVICAAMEYQGACESAALQTITEKISANTRTVLERSRGQQITPREAAQKLALNRIVKAMSYRRWSRQEFNVKEYRESTLRALSA